MGCKDLFPPSWFNLIALRMAKTLWSFGCSECNRVKHFIELTQRIYLFINLSVFIDDLRLFVIPMTSAKHVSEAPGSVDQSIYNLTKLLVKDLLSLLVHINYAIFFFAGEKKEKNVRNFTFLARLDEVQEELLYYRCRC